MDSFTWRRVLVTVSMMMIAFFVAGAATAVVFGRDATQNSGTAAGKAKRSPSPSPSASPAASPTRRPPNFRCWDDRGVNRVSECSEPKDVQGLAWVFPTFAQLNADSKCGPRGIGPLSIGRLFFYDCNVRVDGKSVTYRFTRWSSEPESRNHYEVVEYPRDKAVWSNFLVDRRVAGTRYQLKGRHETTNKFRLSVLYANGLWSMSVESLEPDVIDRAFGTVTFRAPERLRGKPVD